MTTTLITGANKGLGRETARRLRADGHDVWVAARDPQRGQQAADELGARFVQLDVTDDDSVTRAAAHVDDESGGLDVLINNAAIVGSRKRVLEMTADDVRDAFATNVFGVVRVTAAFVPLLERSENPVIVNVTSTLGSLFAATDPEHMGSTITSIGYPVTKAALNMLTVQYAKALPSFRVNMVCPGFTATDLNDHRGTQSVEDGARIIVEMAKVVSDGPTGTFVDINGPVPW